MTTLFLLFLISLITGGVISAIQTVKASDRIVALKLRPFLASVVPAALFFVLFMGTTTVDSGSVGVVRRFGQVIGTVPPGLHFVRPIGDTVYPVAVQRRIVKVSENASSSDLQVVFAEVTLGYHVDPKYADFVLVELNDDAETRVVIPATLEAIKAETAQYEVQGLIKNREQVRAGIENRVRGRLQTEHIVLEDASITNFKFSDAYEQSIEAKQVAEQDAEKARNVLEQTKIEAQQAVATAQGQATARVAQAKGEADAILVEAQAKAKAQELQKANITPELIQIRTIELLRDKWDGSLPVTFLGNGGVNPANILIQPPNASKKKTAQDDSNTDTNNGGNN